jgi:hypothetical protein
MDIDQQRQISVPPILDRSSEMLLKEKSKPKRLLDSSSGLGSSSNQQNSNENKVGNSNSLSIIKIFKKGGASVGPNLNYDSNFSN